MLETLALDILVLEILVLEILVLEILELESSGENWQVCTLHCSLASIKMHYFWYGYATIIIEMYSDSSG